jgi:hypothetical protein
MGIVTEKQFLTSEELEILKNIQQNTQDIMLELGEIEIVKIQLENRYDNTKQFLKELLIKEKEFTSSIFEKYGKSSIDPNTGEIIKID